jgi:uncharacterized protein YggE
MKMVAVLLVLAIPSFGGFNTYQENVINIQGNAKITVVPDIATFFIGASSISNDVDSAILNCKSATLKLNEIIAKYKIKSQDIKSDKLTVSDNYEFIEGKRVRTGCKVLKTYKITYRNLSTLDQFLLEAVSYGSNEIDRISFEHSKIDSLKRAVIALAIDDAHVLGIKMAEKSNVKLGEPIVISNVDPKSFSYENVFVDITAIPEPKFVKGGAIAGSTKVNSTLKELFTINIGTIDITNSVYVTYSIAK